MNVPDVYHFDEGDPQALVVGLHNRTACVHALWWEHEIMSRPEDWRPGWARWGLHGEDDNPATRYLYDTSGPGRGTFPAMLLGERAPTTRRPHRMTEEDGQ